MKYLLFPLLMIGLLLCPLNSSLAGTETTIKDISWDGEVIILQDGTAWRVMFLDEIESFWWLPGDRIIVSDDQKFLTNLNDQEVVQAYRIDAGEFHKIKEQKQKQKQRK